MRPYSVAYCNSHVFGFRCRKSVAFGTNIFGGVDCWVFLACDFSGKLFRGISSDAYYAVLRIAAIRFASEAVFPHYKWVQWIS